MWELSNKYSGFFSNITSIIFPLHKILAYNIAHVYVSLLLWFCWAQETDDYIRHRLQVFLPMFILFLMGSKEPSAFEVTC